jgi:hypothetical protein
MNNKFFQKVETALEGERLDAFRQDGADPLFTLSRYLWNMAVCESLYSPLQMAEIVLRNRIHAVFSAQFHSEDWYTTSGLLLSWQEEQVDKAIKELKNKGIAVTPCKVVAELHFGFWTGFLNRAHERTGVTHALIKPLFRFAPKYEREARNLDGRWTQIRELRNRVFHHERIIHWTDLVSQHSTLVEAIGWISPEIRELTEKLDTFPSVHRNGIDPLKEKIRSHWSINIEGEQGEPK